MTHLYQGIEATESVQLKVPDFRTGAVFKENIYSLCYFPLIKMRFKTRSEPNLIAVSIP
jgi:hypothetical protein